MSQDSEQNDRGGRPSRDGDPQRRDGRSFGRRDDARTSGPTGPRTNSNRSDDRPRFSRDNDRPKFNRPADGDRPRFNRDDRNSGPRGADSRDAGSPSRPFRPAGSRDNNRNDGPRNDRGQNCENNVHLRHPLGTTVTGLPVLQSELRSTTLDRIVLRSSSLAASGGGRFS